MSHWSLMVSSGLSGATGAGGTTRVSTGCSPGTDGKKAEWPLVFQSLCVWRTCMYTHTDTHTSPCLLFSTPHPTPPCSYQSTFHFVWWQQTSQTLLLVAWPLTRPPGNLQHKLATRSSMQTHCVIRLTAGGYYRVWRKTRGKWCSILMADMINSIIQMQGLILTRALNKELLSVAAQKGSRQEGSKVHKDLP